MNARIFNEIAKFYGGDPYVAWLVTFALLIVLAAITVAVQHAIKERRTQLEAEQFTRKMRAVLGAPADINYPPPKPGPKGIRNKFPRAS